MIITNTTPSAVEIPTAIWGMNNEYIEAEIFSVLMGLLVLSMMLGFCCHQKLHQHWLPEASITMIVGIIAGGGLRLYQTYINDKNGGAVTGSLTGFDGATFFNILLPPVIFASGFNMKRTYFFYNLDKILAFAFIGTAVSTAIIGLSLWGLGALGASTSLSLAEALTFGALISATDPVSTLAVFESLRVSPKLFYIVFGESVLNDAVAIVLFQSFQSSICAPAFPERACEPTTVMTFITPLLSFMWIFGGSMLVGIATGITSALLFKLIDLRHAQDYEGRAVIELALFGAFAYLPFLLAQAIGMSGIVAILFAGMLMRHYTFNNLSQPTKEATEAIVPFVAALADVVVFLDLSMSFFGYHGHLIENLPLLAWTLVLCLVGRAAHVLPISMAFGLPCVKARQNDREGIRMNNQAMIWFSGLRGAIAYALCLEFPGVNQGPIMAATIAMVFVTVIGFGSLTVPVLKLLKISRLSAEDWDAVQDGGLAPDISKNCWLSIDRKFIAPCLIREDDIPHHWKDNASMMAGYVADADADAAQQRIGGAVGGGGGGGFGVDNGGEGVVVAEGGGGGDGDGDTNAGAGEYGAPPLQLGEAVSSAFRPHAAAEDEAAVSEAAAAAAAGEEVEEAEEEEEDVDESLL